MYDRKIFNVNPTLQKITDVLSNFSASIQTQLKQDTHSFDNEENITRFAEDKTICVKSVRARMWEYKLPKRKEAFRTKRKNEGLASKYGEWLFGYNLIFPRHLQQNCIPNEPPAQTKLREKGVWSDFKNIKLMKMRALRKHSLHEKTAASVLLKLFISSNE